MQDFLTTENLIALLTLTSLEIVLGIDNIVFISILTGKLPKEAQPKARRVGLAMAMLMRIALLSSLGAADSTGSLGFRCVRPMAAPPPTPLATLTPTANGAAAPTPAKDPAMAIRGLPTFKKDTP